MFRQHRQHAIRKINRRGSRTSFNIERAADAYVVAHIGDGDYQAPAAAVQRFGINRVIEVLGVFAVDGHQRQIAQVLAAGTIRREHIGRKAVRGLNNLGRERLRQIMTENRKAGG